MSGTNRCGYRRNRATRCRSNRITFRISDEERRDIERAAASCQLALGAYVGQAVLAQARRSRLLEDGGLRELYREVEGLGNLIRRVGTNVNQLAKAANATSEIDHSRLGPTLAFVRRTLTRVDETCREVGERLP